MNSPHPHDDTLLYLERQKRWDRRITQMQRSTYQIVGVGVLVGPLMYLFPTGGVWIACVLLGWALIVPLAALTLDGLEALVERANRQKPDAGR